MKFTCKNLYIFYCDKFLHIRFILNLLSKNLMIYFVAKHLVTLNLSTFINKGLALA